jgi:hypothetical protein
MKLVLMLGSNPATRLKLICHNERLMMHDVIKIAVGIEKANCSTCANLSSESDGGEPEYSESWPVCMKFSRYEFLKPFPFKTEQKCWEPEFWHSKFTSIVDGTDESVMKATGAFKEALESVSVPNTSTDTNDNKEVI